MVIPGGTSLPPAGLLSTPNPKPFNVFEVSGTWWFPPLPEVRILAWGGEHDPDEAWRTRVVAALVAGIPGLFHRPDLLTAMERRGWFGRSCDVARITRMVERDGLDGLGAWLLIPGATESRCHALIQCGYRPASVRTWQTATGLALEDADISRYVNPELLAGVSEVDVDQADAWMRLATASTTRPLPAAEPRSVAWWSHLGGRAGLYCAAGLTPEEAFVRERTGSPRRGDVEALLGLAALRGNTGLAPALSWIER